MPPREKPRSGTEKCLASLRRTARNDLKRQKDSMDPKMLAWMIKHNIEAEYCALRLEKMIKREDEFIDIDEGVRLEAAQVAACIGVEERVEDLSPIEKRFIGKGGSGK